MRARVCAWLCIAAAVAVVMCCIDRTAQASCGDYLVVGSTGHGGARDDGSMTYGVSPDSPHVPACHGPQCRHNAPLPAAPDRGLSQAGPDHWALAICSSSPDLDRQDNWFSARDSAWSQVGLDPPEHPPRN